MEYLATACGVLLLAVVILAVRLARVKAAIRAILRDFNERIHSDTNTLITTDCADADVKRLAAEINKSLVALREEKHRLKQSDAELKTAVTNISHDLRTPLTAICGYLELLEREEKSADVARYLAIISGRVELLIDLTDELFRYSVILSVAEGEREEVSLNALVEEGLASVYAELSGKGITPRVSLPDERVMRVLDRSAMARVIANLLSNAIKHGGESLSVALTRDGVMMFSNPAPDMTEVEVGRLFERFYTVSAARKSTGLGLAIAKTLVEQMGGTITARHENGELTVTVCL